MCRSGRQRLLYSGWRNVDDGGGGTSFFDGILDGIEDREAVDVALPLAGGDAADLLSAVVTGALGMEQAGCTGDSLGRQVFSLLP